MSDVETLCGVRTKEDERQDVRHSLVQQMLSNGWRDAGEILRSAEKCGLFSTSDDCLQFTALSYCDDNWLVERLVTNGDVIWSVNEETAPLAICAAILALAENSHEEKP